MLKKDRLEDSVPSPPAANLISMLKLVFLFCFVSFPDRVWKPVSVSCLCSQALTGTCFMHHTDLELTTCLCLPEYWI